MCSAAATVFFHKCDTGIVRGEGRSLGIQKRHVMAATFSSKPFFYDQRDLTSTATQDHEGASYLSEPSRGVPRQRTSYFFPKSVGEYHFGVRHPTSSRGPHSSWAHCVLGITGKTSYEASQTHLDQSSCRGLRASQADGRLSAPDGLEAGPHCFPLR